MPFPQGAQVHRMQRGSDPVPHHVSKQKSIMIGIQLFDGEKIAANDVMWHVIRREANARVFGQIRFEREVLNSLRSLQIRQHRRYVPKRLNATDDLPARIANRSDRHLHWYPLALFPLGEND